MRFSQKLFQKKTPLQNSNEKARQMHQELMENKNKTPHPILFHYEVIHMHNCLNMTSFYLPKQTFRANTFGHKRQL